LLTEIDDGVSPAINSPSIIAEFILPAPTKASFVVLKSALQLISG